MVAKSGPFGWDFAAFGFQGPPKMLPKWIRDPILIFLWFGIDLGTILAPFWFLFCSLFVLIGSFLVSFFIRSTASTPTTIRSQHETIHLHSPVPQGCGGSAPRPQSIVGIVGGSLLFNISFYEKQKTWLWLPLHGLGMIFSLPKPFISNSFLSTFHVCSEPSRGHRRRSIPLTTLFTQDVSKMHS